MLERVSLGTWLRYGHDHDSKEKRGLSAADQQARREFGDLVHAVINPSALAESMAETTAWLKGERSSDSTYFTEKPGHDQR